MPTGAITQHIDVAQVVLYTFWLFFAGLVYYLRREDRREGYPLVSEVSGEPVDTTSILLPGKKLFYKPHGGTGDSGKPDTRPIKGTPVEAWSGSPFDPEGDPMLSGMGPGAWAERADEPDLTHEGLPKIVPMRVLSEYSVAATDVDPRGLDVVGLDGEVGGTVVDLWVDRGEQLIRYLEVELAGGGAAPAPAPAEAEATGGDGENAAASEGAPKRSRGRRSAGAGRVLLPMTLARISRWNGQVKVSSIRGAHFANVPTLAKADQVTLLEEDKICAYYCAGHLYATPDRMGPVL